MRAPMTLALAAAMVLSSVCAAANAATQELELQAREALRNGQFRQAIAVTSEITRAEPGSTLNWYRMAIAAEKERDYALAARALETATKLDPTLAFASSPERVHALRASIIAGSNPLPPALIERVRSVESDGAASAPAAPIVAASAPAAAPVPAAVAKAASEAAQDPKPQPAVLAAPAAGSEPAWLLPLLAYSLVALAALAALVWALNRATRRWLRARMVNVATMPLDDLIAHCRDNLSLLQQRLEYHGHQDSELAVVISRLQPEFARQCGRSAVALQDFKDERPLADLKAELPARIPILGAAASPAQLHADAVQQALQQRRWA